MNHYPTINPLSSNTYTCFHVATHSYYLLLTSLSSQIHSMPIAHCQQPHMILRWGPPSHSHPGVSIIYLIPVSDCLLNEWTMDNNLIDWQQTPFFFYFVFAAAAHFGNTCTYEVILNYRHQQQQQKFILS